MIQLDTTQLIQLCLAVPLLAAFVAAVVPYRNVRDTLVVLIASTLPFFVYKIYQALLTASAPLEWRIFEIIPGIAIYFKIEALGIIFAIILALLWVVSLIYSIGYMRGNNENNQGCFFAYFCISIFAAIGVAFAGNLLTLFVFYEILTLSTYPLVTHYRSREAVRAGRIYLGILLGASMLFFLPAIILTFNITGTLDFTSGGILSGKASPQMIMLLLGLFILGTAKAALIPVHKWLPVAMVAPAPVSGLLHAVAVVKAGVFAITKVVVYIFGVDNLAKAVIEFGQYGDWLLYFASFTVIMASIIALAKDDFKQRLAYSTISQLGYVIMALALFSPKGVIAAAFQIAAHAFAKIVMFFCAGSIYTSTHKQKVSEFSGIGKRMPFTFVALSIAAISLIGLPPTVGFFAKWYIIDGTVGPEQYVVVAVIAISTMLSAAYFLPIIYKAFFGKEENPIQHHEAPFLMVFATCLTAITILVLFAWPDIFITLAEMVGK